MVILLASCIRRNSFSFSWEYSGAWKMNEFILASDEPWELHGWDMDLLGYVNGVLPRERVEGQIVAVLDSGFRDDQGWQIYDVFDGSFSCADHGSHVAGSVAFLSPGPLICIRVTDGIVFDMATIAEGIRLAVELGATIINMSFGGGMVDPLGGPLYEAIQYASNAGVLLVASAGNAGKIVFPAAFPEVIAVGSLTDSGRRSSFSAVGDTWAYGENVSSLVCSGVGVKSGTSMSAPQVSALLASGVGASDLWLAGFGVPFNPPGEWYVYNENGYDREIVKVTDKISFVSRIGKVWAYRDDDGNGVPSPGDLGGPVSIFGSSLCASAGRLLR